MKERKELCRNCVGSDELPHFVSGMGTICQLCYEYQACGEFEKINGKWVSFAVYRKPYSPKKKANTKNSARGRNKQS